MEVTIMRELNLEDYKKAIAMTHRECYQKLVQLDTMEKEVSAWEAKFIESNLERVAFTTRQKEVVYKMWLNYIVDNG